MIAFGRKSLKAFAILTVILLSVLLISACSRETIISDSKTVNVRLARLGYGTSWAYKLKDKFEELYKEQGYKINILTPSSDISGSVVSNELMMGGNGIDLYLAGPVGINSVIRDGNYYVEDLTDIVWNKPAIRFDGTEEEINIIDKVLPGMIDSAEYNGRLYSFFYTAGATGLAVNKHKLSMYGLSYPMTTNELFKCFDKILTGSGTSMGNSLTSGIFPHTFISGNTGYPLFMQYTLLAQMMGYENFIRFQQLVDENGELRLTDGYLAQNDPALLKVMEVMYRMFDQNYATFGSTTQNVGQAQASMMRHDSGAVFMINGDWMLNEVSLNFPNQLENIDMIPIPIISALGKTLFGQNTTYNLSEEQADEILSFIARKFDEGLTAQEIITLVQSEKSITLQVADVERVMEARGTYYTKGIEHNVYITKNSQSKDVAALFLRMLASDDNALLYTNEANAASPFAETASLSEYDFIKNSVRMAYGNGAKTIHRYSFKGLRKDILVLEGIMYPQTGLFLSLAIANQQISMYSFSDLSKTGNESVYLNAATTRFNNEVAYMQNNWNIWMSALS